MMTGADAYLERGAAEPLLQVGRGRRERQAGPADCRARQQFEPRAEAVPPG
jgi:hypothetical protein